MKPGNPPFSLQQVQICNMSSLIFVRLPTHLMSSVPEVWVARNADPGSQILVSEDLGLKNVGTFGTLSIARHRECVFAQDGP